MSAPRLRPESAHYTTPCFSYVGTVPGRGGGYSARVRETLTDLGVSYVVHNPRSAAGETRNEQTHDQLRTLGGQDQIPFLVDHERGVTMYESTDIVAYLEAHYDE